MTLMLGGQDAMSCALGGDTIGYTGTASGTTTATTLTATGTPWVANAYVGHVVIATTTVMTYGVIVSNTTSALTVDRWYVPGSPAGTAATTPSNTTPFIILPGQAPYWYMALGTSVHTPATSDTTLAGEPTTTGAGLIRNIATYAHTTGATTYTMIQTFTVNGTDTGLPATIYNIGSFNTLTPATGRMLFQTALTPTSAVVSAIGDAVTITQTVTV
jgi:hypothetical protein